SEGFAQAILARALVSQRKLKIAEDAVKAAETMLRTSQNQLHRSAAFVSAAQLHAASGRRGDVRTDLETLKRILDEVTKSGAVDLQLDLRLAIGELELQQDAPAARARLAALQKDAAIIGFDLIARKAAALSTR